MDTSGKDTMSDSDSGSSRGSWVFVDENDPTDVNQPNQFYLNCLVEPVQELTENDLGRLMFLFCFDSWINKIVFAIVLFEGVVDCDSDSDGISVISETDESLTESSSDSTQDFYTARSGLFCDEVDETVENIGNVSERAANVFNLRKLFIASSLIGAGVVVVAILIAPYIAPPAADSDVLADDVAAGIPKKYYANSADVNARFYCKKKKPQFTLRYATAEKTHNESRKYGKFYTNKGESKRHFENDYRAKNSFKIKHANSVDRVREEDMIFVRENKKSKKRKQEKNCGCGSEIKSKEKVLKAKEEYLAKKEEYLIKKEYELSRKKIKLAKKCDGGEWKKKNKKYHKIEQGSNKKNHSNGEWYVNFHVQRENARKREQMADWFFDRASGRNRIRDEARWYFEWMIGRQEGRYKKPPRRLNTT